jgi:cardiolipin synthase (CMP-forming)
MKIDFKEILLIPNLISSFRLLLGIPFFYYLSNINEPSSRSIVIVLIFVAFISDLLDGFVARKTNSVSELGKIIDPLADKTLIVLIITFLYINKEISSIYLLVVILRDVLIFVGGIILSKKIGKVLPSNILGKITVFSIGIFIIINFFQLDKESGFYYLFFYLSLCLCVVSLIGYMIRAIEVLKWNKNENIFTS